MTMTINFKDREGYVQAVMKGEFDQMEVLAIFEKMFLYMTTKKNNKVMIDTRELEGNIPWDKMTAITQKMDSIHSKYDGFTSNGVVIAVLTSKEHFKLLSDTIFQSKDHDFLVASEYDEAETWLLSKEIVI